jgi:hypothetical protein
MSKRSLESTIRNIAEGAESGKPTPKVSTPGQPELPSEGGDPGKGGNDPKAKGGVEEPMKDKLLTDPEDKHADIAKASNATSKAAKRKADKGGAESMQKVKEEEEVEDLDLVAEESDESDEDVEIIEVDEDIFNLVTELDEDELRARYAELLSAVMEEQNDSDDNEEIAEEEVAEIRRRITADDIDLSEDVAAMFDSEDLSEDFQTKAKTIFEAAVLVQVNNKLDELEESFKQELAESINVHETELTNKIDDYLNYVVEEWMTKNELAVERGLRAEIAEEFIGGLQKLFIESYIDVPESKVDVLDEMATEIDELKAALNEQIEANIDLQNARTEVVRESILIDELSELADSQIEKIADLAESVQFEDEDQYRKAINILKESYLPKAVDLTEDDDADVDEEFAQTLSESVEQPKLDDAMSQYVRALGGQLK